MHLWVRKLGYTLLQVDLPAQLSVDLVHCERAAQQAVAESGGALRLLQAELFSSSYFDNLAAEINEVLQVTLPFLQGSALCCRS